MACDFGVGWHTIMRAVIDHGTPLVDDPALTAGVRALGVDKTSLLRVGPRRRARFVTGLVDLSRNRLRLQQRDRRPPRADRLLRSRGGRDILEATRLARTIRR